VKLQQAVLTLPVKQQLAFNFRYFDELSYEEIATITDSTAANVKANYHFAKEKIVEYMKNHD
jgi:RNA polymerase sigma-70 factor (ECF subfamily)